MPQVTIQSPIDQPTGKYRLLDGLRECLHSDHYNSFHFIVAFAKVGPLLRLEEDIDNWLAQGKKLEAIFGIDEKGTSIEALQFSLAKFNRVYIAHVQAGAFNPTFHPKMYHFAGNGVSKLYIGSNNLTVGGVETNAETNVCLDFSHEEDAGLLQQAHAMWDSSLSISKRLDRALLEGLGDSGLIVSEKTMRLSRAAAKRGARAEYQSADKPRIEFPAIKIMPPSPLPKMVLVVDAQKEEPARRIDERIARLAVESTEGLVMQITPHHNGEVFLSKTAVNQNKGFFDFPFAGMTTPKLPGNPSYPQREPDPVVDVNVYSSKSKKLITLSNFKLNTVYYEAKSEIRITMPPPVVQATPPFSILVMSKTEEADRDYILDIYAPGSEEYASYLAVCNQTMPSGGNAQPRKFGWL